MKVYVVTEGSDSDYHICCVCSTKEKAEEARVLYRDDESGIEEYDIDDYSIKPQGMDAYEVIMDRHGEVLSVGQCVGKYVTEYGVSVFRRCVVYPKWQVVMTAHVWARDEEHAIKITNEKRIEAIANNEWNAVEGRDA